ncbi:hypothetical protein ACOME3_007312 [Neoechinorhynchus agilis]
MADYLASIFGTEKDKVNCSFYFKVGACRHGERCSKLHNKPTFSQTVLLKNVYLNPVNNSALADKSLAEDDLTDEKIQKHFDETFEEIFLELERKYGTIEEMNICDNLSEHLAGNCYVKFRYEKDAQKAVDELNNRWFDGRPVYAELSPVTDFHEACCRQYQMGECPRGGFCNENGGLPFQPGFKPEMIYFRFLVKESNQRPSNHPLTLSAFLLFWLIIQI